jgi:hypothetical protein
VAPVFKPAGLHSAVDAHAGAAGGLEDVHRAGGRHEAAAGVFAVDPEFEGVPDGDRVGVVEPPALGEPELLPHEVDAGDFLRHGVLDLEPGVDLEEGDGAVLADQELAGAGAHIADLGEDRLGRAVHLGRLRLGQERGRRLLDQFLVPALERAVAGGHDDDVAVDIRQALRLDVAGLVEVLLDEALAATERGHGLAGGRIEEFGHLFPGAGDLEAPTAATEGGLDRDGKPVHIDEVEYFGRVRDRVEGAGGHRGVHLLRHVPGGDLVAELLDRLGGRADPDETRVDHGPGEAGVLGEEPVTGVHGVGAGAAGDGEELLDHEVSFRAGRPVEPVGLVGEARMDGVAILVGVDGDREDAAVFRGADHPDGDLAPVGDEDLRYE